ncbi:MAG TPA: GspE/PulE family protein [Pseudolabrys sp.]|nr:GspE/PulE family protein [Pseudolabrys sp.]
MKKDSAIGGLTDDVLPWSVRPDVGANIDYEKFEAELGTFLVDEKIIDRLAVDRARSAARKTGDRFDRVLTKLGLISEADITTALSKYFSVPKVAAADLPLMPIAPDIIQADFVRRNYVLPLAMDDVALTLGVTDLFNTEPILALAYLTRLTIKLRIFATSEFEQAFKALYATDNNDGGKVTAGHHEASELDVQRLRDMASEAPVILLVNQLIIAAVEARASDIHIEPGIEQVLVRYRIDGVLRTAQSLSPALRAAITSRIKIMSKLDIAERRMPQDGRIKMAVRGVDIDFRVSTVPTMFGESIVMRILDRTLVELDFERLGFTADQIALLHKLMFEPNGIVLVTGPTGSGKTTTLYTALKKLNSIERKIFSVEDPIEYQLSGVNQVQVQAEIGFDFPHALRAILRQDPDIIMIGEIRDLETARIAIQASLTGHLVLSTLHTNSAATAITRLIDIGIENYLLASTVKGVLAQRLVRKLCPHCACEHELASYWTSELARTLPNVEANGPPTIRMAKGCKQCGNTGYSGRSTISEILLLNEEVHRLILAEAPDDRIDAAARQAGMTNMYAMGAVKIWRGETTAEEVLRVTRMG